MNFARTYRRRWSDDEHCFGPFTYAYNPSYRPLAVILFSGEDEYPGAGLRFSAFGHTLIAGLPGWLVRPYREKVYPSWDAETVKRIGRDWYWQIDQREFGFTICEGHLNVPLGRQTHDSRTERRWGCFLPWTQWRFVRHSFYGLKGEHVASLPDIGKSYLGDPGRYSRERAIADAMPTVFFEFDDFDGERITATTKIEEREWKFGTGWFNWLSLFRKAKICRSLDIRFSAETGKRKGSWKGGTVGHSIDMIPGELHESAFYRYCRENEMSFVGKMPA